jgi:hypothetical protein
MMPVTIAGAALGLLVAPCGWTTAGAAASLLVLHLCPTWASR